MPRAHTRDIRTLIHRAWLAGSVGLYAVLSSCGGDAGQSHPSTPSTPVVPKQDRFVAFIAGQGLSDTVDATPSTSVIVSIVDAAGNPRPGLSVGAIVPYDIFQYSGRPATFTTNSPVTDATGKITFTMHLGPFAGTFRLVVSDPELHSDTLSFTVHPGAPARVKIAPQDTAEFIGRNFRFTTTPTDRHSNPTTAPATIAYQIDSGSAVTVASDGSATGAAYGRVRLHATLIGGIGADTARVSVVPPGMIAYAVDGGADHPGIAVANLDGSNRRLLAPGGNGEPSWTPDGNAIAFSSGFIYRVDTNGVKTKLSGASPAGMHWQPRYSYDGASLYFSAGSYPNPIDVYRMPADGSSAAVQVSPARGLGNNGFWSGAPSPDGSLLAFVEAGGALHVYSLLTKTDRQLPIAAEVPRFSPDGSWISYADPSTYSIRIVRPDGSGIRRVTPDGVFAFGWHDWSPDGAWIVCQMQNEFTFGQNHLYVVRVSDALVIPLPFTTEDDNAPTWKPR